MSKVTLLMSGLATITCCWLRNVRDRSVSSLPFPWAQRREGGTGWLECARATFRTFSLREGRGSCAILQLEAGQGPTGSLVLDAQLAPGVRAA